MNNLENIKKDKYDWDKKVIKTEFGKGAMQGGEKRKSIAI
jgi:hypothetical protein